MKEGRKSKEKDEAEGRIAIEIAERKEGEKRVRLR
jgi:hypothetical protein